MSFEDEEEAFRAYMSAFPESSILLIDTYDTVEGARRAARLGPKVKGVRLDSGDLAQLAFEVRQVLDQAGCPQTKIVASSDLNEYRIEEMLATGAPLDLFGVGTELATSRDAPSISGVYKLVEQENPDGSLRHVVKKSPGKKTYPGKKQVFRLQSEDGSYLKDRIALAEDPPPPGTFPLLEQRMKEGKRLQSPPSLNDIQQRCREQLSHFDERYLRLKEPETYPIEYSERIEEARRKATAAIDRQKRGGN